MKKYMILNIFALLIALAFVGCTAKPAPITPPPVTPPETSTSAPEKADCSMVSETLVLANQTVKLPAEGNFVLESHLVAAGEFPKGKWPKDGKDGIEAHIIESCELLKKKLGTVDCDKWYASKYVQVWTPSEGGNIGQGSSSVLPTLEEEMWSGNMMWKSRPAPGTKFLAQKDGKSVVVGVGWETGPGSASRMGGLQGEIMFYLGANNSSKIKWGRLVNQSLELGPINCK